MRNRNYLLLLLGLVTLGCGSEGLEHEKASTSVSELGVVVEDIVEVQDAATPLTCEDELNSCFAENGNLSSQNTDLTQQLAGCTEKKGNLISQVDGLNVQNTDLTQQLAGCTEKKDNLISQVDGLNVTLVDLNAQLDALGEECELSEELQAALDLLPGLPREGLLAELEQRYGECSDGEVLHYFYHYRSRGSLNFSLLTTGWVSNTEYVGEVFNTQGNVYGTFVLQFDATGEDVIGCQQTSPATGGVLRCGMLGSSVPNEALGCQVADIQGNVFENVCSC